jgi:hypothetical protein
VSCALERFYCAVERHSRAGAIGFPSSQSTADASGRPRLRDGPRDGPVSGGSPAAWVSRSRTHVLRQDATRRTSVDLVSCPSRARSLGDSRGTTDTNGKNVTDSAPEHFPAHRPLWAAPLQGGTRLSDRACAQLQNALARRADLQDSRKSCCGWVGVGRVWHPLDLPPGLSHGNPGAELGHSHMRRFRRGLPPGCPVKGCARVGSDTGAVSGLPGSVSRARPPNPACREVGRRRGARGRVLFRRPLPKPDVPGFRGIRLSSAYRGWRVGHRW